MSKPTSEVRKTKGQTILIKRVWYKNRYSGNASYTQKQVDQLISGVYDSIEILLEDDSQTLATIIGQKQINEMLETLVEHETASGRSFMMASYTAFKGD